MSYNSLYALNGQEETMFADCLVLNTVKYFRCGHRWGKWQGVGDKGQINPTDQTAWKSKGS